MAQIWGKKCECRIQNMNICCADRGPSMLSAWKAHIMLKNLAVKEAKIWAAKEDSFNRCFGSKRSFDIKNAYIKIFPPFYFLLECNEIIPQKFGLEVYWQFFCHPRNLSGRGAILRCQGDTECPCKRLKWTGNIQKTDDTTWRKSRSRNILTEHKFLFYLDFFF